MVAALRQVHAQMDEHAVYGEAPLRQARTMLASVQSRGDLQKKIRLNYFIGQHELRKGRTREAIKSLKTAHELVLEARRSAKMKFPGKLDETMLYGLAVAYLRLGETENCIHCRTGESCILPIRGAGIHTKQLGSQEAIKYLLRVLKWNPKHLESIWLLNVAHMTLGLYPEGVPEKFLIPPQRFESQAAFPRFENVAANLELGTRSLFGGAIADDFDGDHLLDLVVSSSDTDDPLRFFHNNGDGSFEDRSQSANLSGIVGGCNLIQADYDNDGDNDVFILRGGWFGEQGRHPNSLLQNDGRGRFRDVTFASGLGDVHFPAQTAAWADYDNDGDLDLYVGNELFPCQLFENDGNGLFHDVAEQAGLTNDRWTKGVTWGDYDGDRFPDLYVSNYQGKNRLFHNNADGSFTDVAAKVGLTGPAESFPVWFWDFNNDGALDLYVPSYPMEVRCVAAEFLEKDHGAEADCLYQGNGRGGFRDVAKEQNLQCVTIPMGANFGDLDNDGYLDFYLGTGYPEYDALMPNLMFRNLGGSGFADVTYAGGFGHLQKGHGVAFADFDHDGDQDVFIEMGGIYVGDAFQDALFENPGFGNHYIKIRLIGRQSNRSAIGAKIKIVVEHHGTRRSIYRWVTSGGSFGANPLRQEIGLSQAAIVKTLEVYWPTTNQTQVFEDLDVNQMVEITEGVDGYTRIPLQAVKFHSPEAVGSK